MKFVKMIDGIFQTTELWRRCLHMYALIQNSISKEMGPALKSVCIPTLCYHFCFQKTILGGERILLLLLEYWESETLPGLQIPGQCQLISVWIKCLDKRSIFCWDREKFLPSLLFCHITSAPVAEECSTYDIHWSRVAYMCPLSSPYLQEILKVGISWLVAWRANSSNKTWLNEKQCIRKGTICMRLGKKHWSQHLIWDIFLFRRQDKNQMSSISLAELLRLKMKVPLYPPLCVA